MKILIIGKYPPLQGGVSAETFFACNEAVCAGHDIHIVTNSHLTAPTNKIAIGGENLRHPAVKLHRISELGSNSFIPWARPDLSQLIGRSLALATQEKLDLIVGWYLEPFGVAAAYVASLTGLPLAIIHAGSDIGRLAENPDLHHTYRMVIETAKHVVVAGDTAKAKLQKLGLRENQIITAKTAPVPSQGAKNNAVDLFGLLSEACSEEWMSDFYADTSPEFRRFIFRYRPNENLLKETTPIVGIFGKMHPAKGIDLLLRASKSLQHHTDEQFRILVNLSGDEDKLCDFFQAIETDLPDILSRIIFCPLVHPALMPKLLRSCDIVCVLDHLFKVTPHQPQMIREALNAGAALVASRESVEKSGLSKFLIDRINYLLVEDPSDINALVSALKLLLTDRPMRRGLQIAGRSFSNIFEKQSTGAGALAATIAAVQKENH